MNDRTFRIAYNGPAIAEGAMNVQDLAPALLALGNLLEESNRVLNREDVEITVRVHAGFRRGSFEIDFTLSQTLINQAKMLVSDEGALISAGQLLELLGLRITLGTTGLLQFIKWLRSRKPRKVVTLENGQVQVELPDERNAVVIQQNVYNLSQDPKVRRSLSSVLAPLNKPGVDVFEIKQDNNPVESITKEEVRFFEFPEEEEEVINISEQNLFLEIVGLVFKKNRKWEFTDGESRITASVLDEQFLNDVEQGRVDFRKGDQLLVTLRRKQILKGNRLISENEIVHVKKYFRRGEQLTVPFD